MIIKHSKYLFPSEEKAREMAESIRSTEEKPSKHTSHGLCAETDKEKSTEEEVVFTGNWQLDAQWVFEDKEEIKHPYGWGKYALDLKHEGNHGISGVSYLDNKL